MQSIHDLDLMHLPVDQPELAANPWPYFAAAKRQHPWLAASNVGFLVHEYQAIQDLLLMDDKMRFAAHEIVAFMGAEGSPWGTFTEGLMLSKHGEEHARLRTNVAYTFSPPNINRFRELIRSTVSRLLDEWAPKAGFDFAEFAANFPIRVMCAIIGASADVVPRIRESMEIQGLSYSMNRDMLPLSDKAISTMMDFVEELLAERAAAGAREHEDLLDDLMAANASGGLSDYELRNLLVFLFGAGYDTSKNMLTLIMHLMLDRPAEWQRCARDIDYCRKVTEEALRYHSVSNTPRTVSEEFVYRDVLFPKGTGLQFILTLSGRDRGAFDEPEIFDPERERKHRHLAFGRGMHICLGQFLARAQIEEGVHLVAQRLTSPKLAGDVTWRPFVGVWGIRSLPITFVPA